MQFQVTEIEFDFDDAASFDKDPNYFQSIVNETVGTIWEADDEDDLVEEITCATGWCVKSVNYRHVLV